MRVVTFDKLDISSESLEIVLDILEQYVAYCTVWAFGSRVTGNARPYSDLDIVVVDKKLLSLAEMADLTEAFDNSNLPFRVDIVDWRRTDEGFRAIIDKSKIVLRDSSP